MKNLQRRVEESVDEFVGKLQSLVAEAAQATLAQRFHQRPLTNPSRVSANKETRGASNRTPTEVGRLGQQLQVEICRSPGETMAVYAAALGMPSSALSLPAHKLIRAGTVRKMGERCYTRYFPIGGSPE